MGQANKNVFTKKITAANTDTQIVFCPWLIQRRYILKKLIIASENAAVGIIKFYDRDLTSIIAPQSGDSVNAPLLEFNIGLLSNLVLDLKTCPNKPFNSGIVANCSVNNIVVTVEIEED